MWERMKNAHHTFSEPRVASSTTQQLKRKPKDNQFTIISKKSIKSSHLSSCNKCLEFQDNKLSTQNSLLMHFLSDTNTMMPSVCLLQMHFISVCSRLWAVTCFQKHHQVTRSRKTSDLQADCILSGLRMQLHDIKKKKRDPGEGSYAVAAVMGEGEKCDYWPTVTQDLTFI